MKDGITTLPDGTRSKENEESGFSNVLGSWFLEKKNKTNYDWCPYEEIFTGQGTETFLLFA